MHLTQKEERERLASRLNIGHTHAAHSKTRHHEAEELMAYAVRSRSLTKSRAWSFIPNSSRTKKFARSEFRFYGFNLVLLFLMSARMESRTGEVMSPWFNSAWSFLA